MEFKYFKIARRVIGNNSRLKSDAEFESHPFSNNDPLCQWWSSKFSSHHPCGSHAQMDDRAHGRLLTVTAFSTVIQYANWIIPHMASQSQEPTSRKQRAWWSDAEEVVFSTTLSSTNLRPLAALSKIQLSRQ